MSQAEPGHQSPTATSIGELCVRTSREPLPPPSAAAWGPVGSRLLWHAANWPEEPAFVFRTADHWTTWTWSETARVALAIGRVLRHSYDLRTGDAIVLDVPNGPEWLALDLGAQMIGAYTIPIYAGSPPPSADTAIAAIGEAAHPRVLFTYRPEVVESFRWREAPIVPATTESMLDLIEQAQGEGGQMSAICSWKGRTSPVGSTCARVPTTSTVAGSLPSPMITFSSSARPSSALSSTGGSLT